MKVKLDSAVSKIENSLLFLSSLSLFIMMLVITLDALMRYLFNSPLQIAYDLTEIYLLPLVVFFTISFALREDAHLRVTFLERFFPKWINGIFNSIGFFLTAVLFLVITYKVSEMAMVSWAQKEIVLGVISWPLYITHIIVAIGSVLIVLRSLILLAGTIVNDVVLREKGNKV